MVGAIDGSHIEILEPEESCQLSYLNYKRYYSVSLIAIVDNEGMFRWLCSGAPGSCSDNGVLQVTEFYKRVEEDQALPADQRRMLVNGTCILGDSAFPESAWMRTPIGVCSTRAEEFFNHKLSSMRSPVKHGLGRLKKKFPALLEGLDFDLADCPIIVEACATLHNFILKRDGESPAEGHDVDPGQTRNGTGRARAGVGAADSERAREVEYLRRKFLRREWGAPGSRADLQRQADEKRTKKNNAGLQRQADKERKRRKLYASL